MKAWITTVLLVGTLALLTSSAQAQGFRKGDHVLGANLTVATTPVGFGVNYEYGVTPEIGIGGILRYWGRSQNFAGGGELTWSVIMPQAQVLYHFMPKNEVDPFVGGRLGYAIYSSSYKTSEFGFSYKDSNAGGLFLTATGGVRYFFSPKVAGNANIEFRIAGEDYFDSGLGLTIGVDFVL